ncbi:MAG: hypothetical protein NTW29_05535 [Bacteroidetes bacterium]|nr:hypothetical protein [Bacteroidota bacterium]
MRTKEKLYKLEITPPAGVWQRIDSELDDAGQGMTFPSTLLQATHTAPISAWSHIEAALDDAGQGMRFPHTLYEAAHIPPPATWSKIVAALDEEVPADTVSAKLAALTVPPPAAAWNKIAQTLNTAEETPNTEKRKILPWLRYTAAAVLVGILAWGGVRLLNNGQQNDPSVAATTPVVPSSEDHSSTPATDIKPETNITQTDTETEMVDEARNDAALEESKKTFAKLDVSPASKIKAAADFYFSDPAITVTSRGLHVGDDNDVPQYTPDPSSEPSRYIMLLTPEGNIIRMSKKLSNMVCCVSGEEQDKDCKDQMQKWREKLACSPATHSTGNFMDILTMAHALQQEN